MCTNLACSTHFSIQSFLGEETLSFLGLPGLVCRPYIWHTQKWLFHLVGSSFSIYCQQRPSDAFYLWGTIPQICMPLLSVRKFYSFNLYCLSHGYYPWYVQKKDACVIAISVCIFSCFHCLLCKMTYTTGIVRY